MCLQLFQFSAAKRFSLESEYIRLPVHSALVFTAGMLFLPIHLRRFRITYKNGLIQILKV